MNTDDIGESSIDDSRIEPSQTESSQAPKSRDFTFGPTEVSIVPTPPEDWTPNQRMAAMVIGAMAMIVGFCGLFGIRIDPRNRDWRQDR